MKKHPVFVLLFSKGEEEDLYASVRVRRKDYEDVEDRHQVSFWFKMISGLILTKN